VVTNESAHLGTELGLTLFMRKGMTAWMRAWPERQLAARSPGANERRSELGLNPGVRGDVVTILVEMALGVCRQVEQ